MNLSSIRLTAKRPRYHRDNSQKHDALKVTFHTDAPNQVWVSDTTFFRVNQQVFYICTSLDLYAHKAIACKISRKHRTQLITAAFRVAYQERHPDKGLVFHSNRGTQYTSFSMQKLLAELGVKQSFSPTGRPQHNAVM